MKLELRRATSALVLVVFACSAALAQGTQGSTNTHSAHSKHEESPFPEVEFVGSSDFRSVLLVVPVYRGLNVEAHYFGFRTHPHESSHGVSRSFGILDVGSVNASWSFHLGEHVILSPGVGVSFGERQTTSPAITFRWEVEKGKLFSQGLFIYSPRESEEFGRTSIWDGNHVSLRLSRLEIGPSWERIHARSENEWKVGGRAAVRLLSNVSLVFFVLAPHTEYRAGLIIHPAR